MNKYTVTVEIILGDTDKADRTLGGTTENATDAELIVDFIREGLFQMGDGRNGDSLNEHGSGIVWQSGVLVITEGGWE